jgi:hypothetical protein
MGGVATSLMGRCCRKAPNCSAVNFLMKDEARDDCSSISSGQLPKSLASSSLYDAFPHTIVGSPHLGSENLR